MKYIKYKKCLILFSLLTISSLSGLFGSFAESTESPSSLRTIPVLEIPGDFIPVHEQEIIDLFQDEEGNLIPVVYRGAAKDWEAASWTPEWFAEQFKEQEINVVSQDLLSELGKPRGHNDDLVCDNKKIRMLYCNDETGLNCRYECFICNEDHICLPDNYYSYYANDNSSDNKYNDVFSNSITTTVNDHITDILIHPKNASYFVCPLPHNTNKLESVYQENDPVLKNMLFAFNHLNIPSQTRFPQSIIKYENNEIESERAYSLFIGSENSISSLHSHPSTFLAQIYGRKIARLIHHQYSEKCSCEGREFIGKCAIDITAPDFEQHPDLKDIEVYETILEPGDVLYIPEGWLHDIRGLSTSISISSGF